MEKKSEEKALLWILVFATFIILIIGWRFYLKIVPQPKTEEKLFKGIENSWSKFKGDFGEILEKFKELKIYNEKPKEKLKEEEIERLKEKILEYVNKKEEK